MACQTNPITINNILVNQDARGRYCLNDLHRAAGLEGRHQPSNFLRLESTQGLVGELSADHSSEVRSAPAEVVNGGPDRGTYVCRELVYAYAAWVSPAFHLRVLRTFDAVATGQVQAEQPTPRQLPTATEEKVAGHRAVLGILQGIPGIRTGIAASVMLDAIHQDTGLTMEPYRKALPPGEGPTGSLNATAVGESLGISARKANQRLEAAGLQHKSERGDWELTVEGAKVGEAIPYTRGSHSGYQVLWKPEVLNVLRTAKP
ncbi:KilA-N domain-containing protein [Myxococcus landrumensis]|uniref:KilA-N domain-containing protein n=1 Tax=Myxococcus landrumensis TaxID=2813577 RepID=A0ABX7N8Q8_9BACT|nr:KilA-N domain-containing protein [Myxococcus landrumus]QSQ14035.1 KilA-N domain-containing protein [Myxococcus landrumus]